MGLIITMATENYLKWLLTFLESLQKFNLPTKVFLINFAEDKLHKLKENYPCVTFVAIKKEVERKPGFKEAYKVTYLKGEFLEQAYEGKPLLWIDCTALIRHSPQELLDKLTTTKALLMRRDFTKEKGKAVYAAEIFGFNDLDYIKKYRQDCDKNKQEWFSDQLALCEVGQERKYIEFGVWSNFNYDEKAKSWSDRGVDGSGINSQLDEDYTYKKYLFDLNNKPRILVHVDSDNWCYVNTAKHVTEMLKDKFNFLIAYNTGGQLKEILEFRPNLVWGRCGSYRNKKLKEIDPRLIKISFSSLTTGGDLLQNRIRRQLDTNKQEAGIIVQNAEAKEFLEEKTKQPIYILPNGCDTEMFTPGQKEEFVVGFNGRATTEEEKELKGYNFFALATKGYKTVILDGGFNKLPFEKMPEFYKKISVLVAPTCAEGCSNTINEALASGVPVLTVKSAWHAEVNRGPEDGIIWISRNIYDIREKLTKLKEDRAYLETLSKNARNWAIRHDWKNFKEIYANTFYSMLDYLKTAPEIKTERNYGLIKVKALKETSLGQLAGINYFFRKDEVREIPYNKETKKTIDVYLAGKFIQEQN